MGYQIGRCGGIVVSGMAYGIDGMAMAGCLTAGQPTVGVLGCGVDIVYPLSNRALFRDTEAYGCILSEFAPGTPPAKWTFPKRNRIIAGLSCGVLVVEAPEKSGALITARYAKEGKKPIFAFPYPPNAAAGVGCNQLIKAGGHLVESAEDIFSKLGIDLEAQKKAMPKPVLSPDEEKMYLALCEQGEGHVNELSAKSGVPVFKARAVLSSLEVKGLSVNLGGNRYGAV
jgi:DNA processing protein